MNLFCVGLNHRTANVETRELFAGDVEGAQTLKERGVCSEVLLLATCNRVEIYGAASDEIATESIVRSLRGSVPPDVAIDDGIFYRHDGLACTEHLFRVAAGLDSMVVGETEILGQTKQAYESARQTGNAGPMLHRVFQRAFRVAKQVRSRTDITRGSVSVGSVAVDLAEKIFGELRGRKVLLVGAGDMSEKTARALHSRGCTELRVTNRSVDRAAELAAQFGGRAVSFKQWTTECNDIDILISSTSADDPLLTREMLGPVVAHRVNQPLFIIDIAVPRDVAPDVNELDGVYLYDIDSLQAIAEQSMALRRQAVAQGEAIVAEHVNAFRDELARFISRGSVQGNCREKPAIAAALRVSES